MVMVDVGLWREGVENGVVCGVERLSDVWRGMLEKIKGSWAVEMAYGLKRLC
jgi:hypothetical protein